VALQAPKAEKRTTLEQAPRRGRAGAGRIAGRGQQAGIAIVSTVQSARSPGNSQQCGGRAHHTFASRRITSL
jgi:hypothetical protein